MKRRFIFGLLILLALVSITLLDTYSLIVIGKIFKLFINIATGLMILYLSKQSFDYTIKWLEERNILKKENSYLIKAIANIVFLALSIFILFFLTKNNLEANPKLFATVMIISFIGWLLFAKNEDFLEYSEKYLRQLGIYEINKNYTSLMLNFKIFGAILALKLSLDVILSSPFLDIGYSQFIINCFDLLLLVYLAITINNLIALFLQRLNYQIKSSNNDMVRNYLYFIPFIKNLATIIVFILFFLGLLNTFGYTALGFFSSLPALFQSIGILSAGLAFIAKDTIANFLSGIFIITDSPFSVGDRVKIGDVYGDVEEIGIRTTKIKTLENTIATVPNSKFIENAVISYRKYNAKIKVFHDISLKYDTDIENAKAIILKIFDECDEILKVPNPKIYFKNMGSYAIEFSVTFWIRDISKKLIALDTFNSKLLKQFKQNNISIAVPTYNVKSS